MHIEMSKPMSYDSLKKSICDAHKGFMIRDIVTEHITNTHIDVSYVRIERDDSWTRIKSRVTIKGD
jgi:hypothetical protein